ncbi:hypothetical protein [Vallitalea guaymasensis]|uniref:hypothetical protein n=1 Tax=Vallitalea guaymasensis TaxID=1185412 RepID=UPI0023568994|nr:hypothetical protein [Vallitalea guaymasensis]
MSKTYEELATEMTVAYIQACGEACSTGKFTGTWLKFDAITKHYDSIYKQIIKSAKESLES